MAYSPRSREPPSFNTIQRGLPLIHCQVQYREYLGSHKGCGGEEVATDPSGIPLGHHV